MEQQVLGKSACLLIEEDFLPPITKDRSVEAIRREMEEAEVEE